MADNAHIENSRDPEDAEVEAPEGPLAEDVDPGDDDDELVAQLQPPGSL